MNFSNHSINKLGGLLRETEGEVSIDLLSRLQQYRVLHKEVLSDVFQILCKSINKIQPSAIVTYRIKRIESIIGKLKRLPSIKLSTMSDIGGCRVIVKSNREVYKVLEFLKTQTNIEILKEKDYIKKPADDGYKSLHLYVKQKPINKTIEVQIRSQEDHNWATLVEITDLMFDSELKERGKDKILLRFHLLLSKKSVLSLNEKIEVANIVKNYRYIEMLSERFMKNYIYVRKQWSELENNNKNKFFLIESKKNEYPKILSFRTSEEAEEKYFSNYMIHSNANIVLTHLQLSSYNNISIAYSNYILTYHEFLDDLYDILEELTFDSIDSNSYLNYFNYYMFYCTLLYKGLDNIGYGLNSVREYFESNKMKMNFNKKKTLEWIKDLSSQNDRIEKRFVYNKKMILSAKNIGIVNKWIYKLIYNFVFNYAGKDSKYKPMLEN
jgi:ppGpp synthetase/RelA/SpoT-type nucleotidyltranferase